MNFMKIPTNRFDDIILHLRETFFSDEPLNKAVRLCKKGKGNILLERHALKTLDDNLSIMAITDDNKIAGVSLNGIITHQDIELSKKNLNLIDDENFKKIFNLLYEENLKIDLFKQFNVDRMFEIRILSVDSRYRGQGLAKKLLEKSEEIAKENDFEVMKTDATGLFSQKISKSLGFQTGVELRYDSYLDEDGKQIFNVESPHEYFKIMFKIIE